MKIKASIELLQIGNYSLHSTGTYIDNLGYDRLDVLIRCCCHNIQIHESSPILAHLNAAAVELIT
jgi:hypothetical protein